MDNNNKLNETSEVYFCELKNHHHFLTCSICLNSFTEIKNKCQISCKHYFHKYCIGSWLNIKKNCPLCRQKCLKYDKEKKEFIESDILEIPNNENPYLQTFSIDRLQPMPANYRIRPVIFMSLFTGGDSISARELYQNYSPSEWSSVIASRINGSIDNLNIS
jgi:hypothetical protein